MLPFADDTTALNGLYIALTAFLYLAITIAQTWYQEWRKAKADREVAAKLDIATKAVAVTAVAASKDRKDAATAAKETKQAVDAVAAAVNGEGLGAAVARIEANQKDHEIRDDARHEEVLALHAKLAERVSANTARLEKQ